MAKEEYSKLEPTKAVAGWFGYLSVVASLAIAVASAISVGKNLAWNFKLHERLSRLKAKNPKESGVDPVK